MATEYLIEPVTAPPGSEDFCLCDEQHATKWYVTAWDNDRKPQFQGSHGVYDSRELAEAYVTELIRLEQRANRFVWRDGDVEHH
jgi:hypothetical protein